MIRKPGLSHHGPHSRLSGQGPRQSRVTWESPTLGPGGYAFASRGYLLGLADLGVQVRSQPLWGDCPMSQPGEEPEGTQWTRVRGTVSDQHMAFSIETPVDEETLQRILDMTNTPGGGVYVCAHVPTDQHGKDFFQYYRERNPGMTAYVGYTMFEAEGIPDPWVDACNQMDEIWVPSRFNRDSFARAGVNPERIHVIPIGFDPARYRPDDCKPLDLIRSRSFCFLSVFEWTYRKGWDVLVRAYLEAFSPRDDVKLILRAYQGTGVAGEGVPEISRQLTDFILHLGYDPQDIPEIELIDQTLPSQLMPNLYKTADAFILPTRGEGWGIPLTEAMLMEVPVIATGWSGQREFMNEENAFPIDVDAIVPVAAEQIRDNPLYAGQRWAEPSLVRTRDLMRHVFENRTDAEKKARRARKHVLRRFTLQHGASKILDRLQALERKGKSTCPSESNFREVPTISAGRNRQDRVSNRPIRALFQARQNVFTVPGGDTEVLVALKRSLESAGIRIDFSSNSQADLQDYDLVHVFNLDAPFALNAALQLKPYVLTPLYEDRSRYYASSMEAVSLLRNHLARPDADRLESALRHLDRKRVGGVPSQLEFVSDHAAAILASGRSEAGRLNRDFPQASGVEVVKFGFNRPLDPDDISPALFTSRYGVKDFVLCVGRIDTRKNQLMLLHALRHDDVPIVFVNSQTIQPEYEELCRQYPLRRNAVFTGRLSRDMLFSAYRAARVHALPSWYELPGLVSLEAAWLGCNVVASSWGTLDEYLGGHFHSCQPHDPDSIREAVRKALAESRDTSQAALLDRLTWDRAAQQVMDIYERILACSGESPTRERLRHAAVLARREAARHQQKEEALQRIEREPLQASRIAVDLLASTPDDPGLHFIQGAALLMRMDPVGAEHHLRRVLELEPAFAVKACFFLHTALSRQGKCAEAAEALRSGLRFHPFLPQAARDLAQEYLQRCQSHSDSGRWSRGTLHA